MKGHLAQDHVTEAVQNSEINRMKLRLDRTERRLVLND